jgi:pimeloyl-ACP methyl ester carboxylesterase
MRRFTGDSMPTKIIRNATIHYIDQGSGPAVVLLHGFPLDHRMWSGQIESLSSAGHRVIAPDFRGFGQSLPEGPFTMESLADDVHALVEQIGVIPFVLAGLSMGGYVALAYARKYPGSLRGLMLLDTKAEPDTAEGREGRGKMIQLVRDKGSRAVGDAMQPKLLAANANPDVVNRLREMTDATSPITIEHALVAMRDRPDHTGMLPSIQAPTLVITGDADAITPPAMCQTMQRAIPHSQLAIIRNSGHMTTMEEPEQVNDAMREFLSRV